MRQALIARIAFAFALVITLFAGGARAQTHSDIWWNPNESGWGLTIADHHSQLFAVWYTYRQDGRPTWYVIPGGTLSSDGLHFQGDLYAATGPAFSSAPFDPSRVAIGKVGTASIDFTSADTANFTYSLAGVGATKAIRRQSFGNAAPDWGNDLTDIWWNPLESGWGFTLAQHGNNLFGVWFTYDTDGQPLWAVMPGVTFNGPDAFTGTLYTTTGPYFGIDPFDPSRVTIAPQGSVTAAVNREGTLDSACLAAQRVRLSWSFRNAAATETVCPQVFGDMPGTPVSIAIPDPMASLSPGATAPGSFMAAGLTLLAESAPAVNTLVPAVTRAEQAVWTMLLSDVTAAAGGKRATSKGGDKAATKSSAVATLLSTAVVGATGGMESMGQAPRGVTLPASTHETTNEGVTVTGTLGGGRYGDGTSHAEFAFAVTTTLDGSPVSASSSADFQGLVCPAADGSLPFKLHVTLGASTGTGAKVTGAHVEILISGVALVNDSANIQNVDWNAQVQESLQRPDSHNAYVDASIKGTTQGEWVYGGSRNTVGQGGKINRMGSTTTAQDRDAMLGELGPLAGVVMGAYLSFLQNDWQHGDCVKVIAGAPSTVAPGSSTPIDARVHTKPDDEDIPVPIDAKLDGGAAVTPARIGKAPGTFTYVAPPQSGQAATINLKTTSRRGIGELSLTIRTAAEGYAVDWTDGTNHVFGTICGGLQSPFTLNFTSGGSTITGTLQFTPSSAAGGAVHLAGQGGGGIIVYSGDGTYSIASGPVIHFSIGQEIAMYPYGSVTVPGPSGDLPLTRTSQCGGG